MYTDFLGQNASQWKKDLYPTKVRTVQGLHNSKVSLECLYSMCMSMVWRYTKLSQGIHLCHLPSHFQRSTVYCPSHSTQSSRAWTSSSFHLSKKEIQIHVNIRFFIKHFLKLIVMKKCEKTLILTEVCVCVCLCVYMCVCACECVCAVSYTHLTLPTRRTV